MAVPDRASAPPAEAPASGASTHGRETRSPGLRRSAIGTPVERTTRFTIRLHPPPDEVVPAERARTATGMRGAVTGHGAGAARDAIAAAITT